MEIFGLFFFQNELIEKKCVYCPKLFRVIPLEYTKYDFFHKISHKRTNNKIKKKTGNTTEEEIKKLPQEIRKRIFEYILRLNDGKAPPLLLSKFFEKSFRFFFCFFCFFFLFFFVFVFLFFLTNLSSFLLICFRHLDLSRATLSARVLFLFFCLFSLLSLSSLSLPKKKKKILPHSQNKNKKKRK